MDTVNKKEFAYKIAEEGGFYKKDAMKMVELFWDTLLDYLEEGKKVNFYGIGNFKLKTVKGRAARNPMTGEPCIIPDRRKIRFCPSETLTESVEDE